MKRIFRIVSVLLLVMAGICALTAADKKPVPTPEPWANWAKAKTLEGGGGMKTTTIIPAFDQWYVGTYTTLPRYYTVNVVKNAVYEIFWDDKSEGSKKYTADITLFAFQMDGKTLYESKDSGYSIPITIKAKESSINIIISALGKGNYAFGLRKK